MYLFDRSLGLDFTYAFGGMKESPSPWYPRIEAAMQVLVGFHHCRFGKSNLTSPRGLNVWSIHLVNRLERLDAKDQVRGVHLGSETDVFSEISKNMAVCGAVGAHWPRVDGGLVRPSPIKTACPCTCLIDH